MIHIMLDLETWGKRPGCDIRSIGACVFNPVTGNVGDWKDGWPGAHSQFYIATDNPIAPCHSGHYDGNNCRKYPLHRDPDTVQWWTEQTNEAQAAFADPVDLRRALNLFGIWLAEITVDQRQQYANDHNMPCHVSDFPNLCIWSHGPQFDISILAAAYEAVGLPVPWHYRAPRDTRTCFDIAGIEDHSAWLKAHPGPLGIAHHALDDAICQARAVCAAWGRIDGWRQDSEIS